MAFPKHGLRNSSEYRAWTNMKARCNNPKEKAYPRYGGRGIKVCEYWNDFENFINDMGMKPSKDHTLERIDNNKGYGPDNCRWATYSEQNRNRDNTVMVTIGDEEMSLAALADRIGMNYYTLHNRLFRHHWPIEKAIGQEVYGHLIGNSHRWKQ